ncbi:hypothetical protein Aeqsu_0075 [Aequorivita sublithincola DSM 14238]|uniref:Lipocalin-like domain-containing protein n=1 Tax=Aequorivita sublithincola (strain DSM 14238 / LMG 21431 / ACAM 643 / 9-3) TaxID=746697 RepID=I3YRI9_AEQSU|nr:hypothetical protein [Aequorivita sublithincola]AFL79607.1 hypothetical protein Aeqsu_0075 [Aequorivita sublithincola DSM 14238]
MKTLLLIIIIFISSVSSDKTNCDFLRVGKFQTENEDGSLTIITRNENKQIENFRDGERISEFDIKWTDECEYLIYNRKVLQGIDPWPELNKDTLKIKITEIKNNFYLTESEMLSKGWRMNQKVEILK